MASLKFELRIGFNVIKNQRKLDLKLTIFK